MINKLRHENENNYRALTHRAYQLWCHLVIGATSSCDGMIHKGIQGRGFSKTTVITFIIAFGVGTLFVLRNGMRLFCVAVPGWATLGRSAKCKKDIGFPIK